MAEFEIEMKNYILLIILLLTIGLNEPAQAQSLKDLITKGNWCISKPIDSLHISDSLAIDYKPMDRYGNGKWIQFGLDSIWKQRRTYHYCKRIKNKETFMLGYKWDKRGKWNIFYENLEITIGNKTIDLMTRSISANRVKFIVATIRA
ncbi:MAG TPA: hypothetical protein VK806_09245 [Bacteroidia bacterium]|jgi:hypothetical protein|nr:hypothetical protein [Bacteroidia bacterium]